MIDVIVKSDYDGYFECLAKVIIGRVKRPKYERVIVTAGPYRADALQVWLVPDDPKAVRLDFYSAIRNGFGSLSDQDLTEAAKLLES